MRSDRPPAVLCFCLHDRRWCRHIVTPSVSMAKDGAGRPLPAHDAFGVPIVCPTTIMSTINTANSISIQQMATATIAKEVNTVALTSDRKKSQPSSFKRRRRVRMGYVTVHQSRRRLLALLCCYCWRWRPGRCDVPHLTKDDGGPPTERTTLISRGPRRYIGDGGRAHNSHTLTLTQRHEQRAPAPAPCLTY